MQIHFLHGTETGTAEFLCEDLQSAIQSDAESEITSLDEIQPSALTNDKFYVFVTATFGSGDLPGTAQDFFDALERDKPDLSHVRFAIFGLGDTTFGETYNQGSEKLMTQLLACNAKMVGERGLFDASSSDMPEDVAIPWLKGVMGQSVAA
ncbi:MAG: flavodoxin domain-containing protein [Pseudomonadota bacterium]